ncbi:helix-turn-helix transcriptional regulator [[Mycobacterium] burgundiense]|uniref:Helix-turn-helix transcriptional regulator n=1 Tax=[Mycobacterium] burgundiense TaxID=3064286 RepID=A0ABM9LK58_9MYCO|nr:helix-turn-helix transcriptional regulator [Mycolicibacterium sp. MU0053]CAJ1500406.1 helix-turn-helix transcriptional regulator [Mycolicibacterium sp. MU0053]
MPGEVLLALADHIANPAVSTIVMADFPAALLLDRFREVSEQLWHSSKTLIVRRQNTHPDASNYSETPVYIEPLTERERQVLSMAAQGASAREIGQRLFISERTVESHVSNGYRKLGIRSRVELVRRALEFGL